MSHFYISLFYDIDYMFPLSITFFCIYLIGYYVVHSILTSHFVKERLNFRGYRIVYNLFAVISLLPVGYQLILSYVESAQIPLSVRGIGILLLIIGIIIHIATFRWFSSAEFLGIKQLAGEEETIITDGIYSTSRHPFYLGTLLMFWGLFILFPNLYFLAFATISTLYVFIGSRLEENKLMVMHRATYQSYRQSVPMLIPWKEPFQFFRFLFKKS